MSYQQQIYNRLRQAGMTEAGALGVLGNWECESNCEPFRVQNDFSSARTYSHTYTANVTSGKITRDQFARDQKGYGLAQWTYFNFSTGQGRKLDLYDFWKKSGKALDDVTMQVDFAVHELSTQGQYATLWQLLKTTDDIWTATDKVCRLYEQPYYCNVDARVKAAKEIQKEIDLNNWQNPIPQNPVEIDEDDEGTPSSTTNSGDFDVKEESEYWPPRMICAGMNGYDVMVLQAILKARGYINPYVDGDFGTYLEKLVKQFQTATGLDADGIVGPLTWSALLKR